MGAGGGSRTLENRADMGSRGIKMTNLSRILLGQISTRSQDWANHVLARHPPQQLSRVDVQHSPSVQ